MKIDKRLAAAAAMALGAVVMPSNTKAALVINEVYQGGGNASASYALDFIELYNNGTAAVSIGGDILQYGAATGNFATNTFTTFTLPAGNVAPGSYYLVAGAGGTNAATALPAPDATSSINMAVAGGKVRLLDSSGVNTIDLVGWGTATNATGPATTASQGFTGPGFETAVAPAPSGNSQSDSRIVTGFDSNNNSVDFAAGAPTPTASGVPEPASLGLIGAASALLIGRRRR